MGRVSCIVHPAESRWAELRSDFVALCEGDHCAAMILSVFESWTNTRIKHRDQAIAINELARSHDEQATQTTDNWVYRTEKQLKESDLMGLFGEKAISAGLKYLTDHSLIVRRVNQNPRYKYDRTLQYRLESRNINRILAKSDPQNCGAPQNCGNGIPQNRGMDTGKTAETIQTPIQSAKPETKTPEFGPFKARAEEQLRSDFDQFYSLYPKKTEKEDARRAWAKLLRRPDYSTLKVKILARVKTALEVDWAGKEKAYIPNPASWLNGQRWEDEAVPPPTPARNGNGFHPEQTRPQPSLKEAVRKAMGDQAP
jgi:hypothetical protein